MMINTDAEKLLLGLSIGMGIVFIALIILSRLVAAQTKLLGTIAGRRENSPKAILPATGDITMIGRQGVTSGEAAVLGVDDEEILAAIMAVISRDIDIPLNQLRFRSIKAIIE